MTAADDEDLVSRARAYAADVHAGDTRKGSGVSYFDGHLEPVAQIVEDHGGSDEQIAAAYLHDAAEDHGGESRLADIRATFGDAVADIVRDLSDSLLDEGAVKEAWRPRKERYIEAIGHKPDVSLDVAAADKLHNARSLLADLEAVGSDVWERFTERDPEQQLWYYRSLADAIARRRPDLETAQDLLDTVAALERAVSPPST